MSTRLAATPGGNVRECDRYRLVWLARNSVPGQCRRRGRGYARGLRVLDAGSGKEEVNVETPSLRDAVFQVMRCGEFENISRI